MESPVVERSGGSWPHNAPRALPLTRTSRGDRDLYTLHAVVAEAGHVPRRFQRLHIAGLVGGAACKFVRSRLSVPGDSPEGPAERVSLRYDIDELPAPVDREFHGLDRRLAGPGAPDNFSAACGNNPAPAIEVGNPGRHHE